MTALVSAEELAGYLQADLDRYTAELATTGASGAVRGYCGWPISQQTETLTVDGSGAVMLSLPTLHLTEVTEVRVNGLVVEPGDPTASTASSVQYFWSAGGQLYRPAGWPALFRCVEVDCTHGYDVVPDVVKVVTLTVAARAYANPERLSTKVVGGTSLSFDFRAVDLSRLDPYRLP